MSRHNEGAFFFFVEKLNLGSEKLRISCKKQTLFNFGKSSIPNNGSEGSSNYENGMIMLIEWRLEDYGRRR